jgi:PKD repeat protein
MANSIATATRATRTMLCVAMLAAALSAAQAADIYVSPGSSITNAMAAANPGDTVHVNAGTYSENVAINTSGTSSAWITLLANGPVVINAGGAGKAIRIAANYIIVNGFECTNYLEGVNMRTAHIKVLNCNFHSGSDRSSSVSGANGLTVNFDSAIDDIDIENSNFYFNDGAGADFGCNATTDVLSNLTLKNCKFYSNNAMNGQTGAVAIGHQGNKSNISVIRCQAYDNVCSGFDMDAPIYMDGCIAHDNDLNGPAGSPSWGLGIKVWGHTGNPPAYGQVTLVNCLAYNNTQKSSGGGGINIGGTNSIVSNCLVSGNNSYAGIIICSGASLTVQNTIFYSEHYAISTDSDVSGLTFDSSSVIFNCTHTGPLSAAQTASAKTFDPQFVNPVDNDTPPWADFHLLSTSPCIDAGVTVSWLTDDADGNPRPSGNGFDIGPYEVQVATNGTPTITSSPTASPNPANTGQAVNFNVAASDADGDTLTYAWTFGDGASGSTASPTHSYTAAGNYTATVTVSDGRGGTATASVAVSVVLPPPPPPAKTLRVAAIAMSLSSTRLGKAASATITVKDANGAAVSGATVAGAWSSLTTANVSGKTSTAGTIKFTSARVTKTGTFTFSVKNLTLAGYSYASSQNAATSASIDTSGHVTAAALAATTALAPSSSSAGTGSGDAISLGSVTVKQAFQLQLPLPPDIPATGVRAKPSNLPAGMRISGTTLNGAAKRAGTFTFTVRFQAKTTIDDDNGTPTTATVLAEQQYSIVVTP